MIILQKLNLASNIHAPLIYPWIGPAVTDCFQSEI